MPLVGSLSQKKGNHPSGVTSEDDDDSRALWILFKGREWIVLWKDSSFMATPGDNRKVEESEVKNLFRYLNDEGFINKDEPMKK